MQLALNANGLAVRPVRQSGSVVMRAHAQRISVIAHPKSRRCVTRRAVAQESNGSEIYGDACEAQVVVKIDNQHDAFATIVTVEFGDILGELLDTVKALQGLGLNIRRAKLETNPQCGTRVHKFFVTDARTSEKVVKSAKIEEIRLTILNNMLKYHPEAEEKLAWGSDTARSEVVRDTDPTHPLGNAQRSFFTQVGVRPNDENLPFTQILVNTLDKPGLLTDIVHILKDINLNVVSAEVDTIGRNAVDTFNVTYHGEPLNTNMQQLAVNCLQYYLSKGEVEKEYTESY